MFPLQLFSADISWIAFGFVKGKEDGDIPFNNNTLEKPSASIATKASVDVQEKKMRARAPVVETVKDQPSVVDARQCGDGIDRTEADNNPFNSSDRESVHEAPIRITREFTSFMSRWWAQK